jgi:hypothetical protein
LNGLSAVLLLYRVWWRSPSWKYDYLTRVTAYNVTNKLEEQGNKVEGVVLQDCFVCRQHQGVRSTAQHDKYKEFTFYMRSVSNATLYYCSW